MDFEYGTIIKQDGDIGIAVTGMDKTWRFKPVKSGSCYFNELPEIKPDAIEASHDEKVKYIISEYTWGKVRRVHEISNFIILEDERINFHIYIDYKDACRSASTLDMAIVAALAYKYDSNNTKADMYIYKMLNMSKESK